MIFNGFFTGFETKVNKTSGFMMGLKDGESRGFAGSKNR